MSITTTLWRHRVELVQSFHNATINGMLNTRQRCHHLGKPPEEPDFVAGLVLESAPLIHYALNSIISPRNISVSMCSIFCHQTPKVTFGSCKSGSCELGDILFAYVHTPKIGSPRRNAILFQAKSSAKQPHCIRSAETDQLCLYRDWPDFAYTQSSFLNGQKRTVTPKTPHSGAQYLLIDDRPPSDPKSGLLGLPGTYPMGCCMPDKYLWNHSHLAAELFNLLIFRTGRPFEEKTSAAKKQDWSQVVWDLLETGVKKSFCRKNSGRHCTPRSVGDTIEMLEGMTFAMASSWLSHRTAADIVGQAGARIIYGGSNDIPPADHNRGNDPQEPEIGTSIILIETSEVVTEEESIP